MPQKLLGILGMLALVVKFYVGKTSEANDRDLLKRKAPASEKE